MSVLIRVINYSGIYGHVVTATHPHNLRPTTVELSNFMLTGGLYPEFPRIDYHTIYVFHRARLVFKIYLYL